MAFSGVLGAASLGEFKLSAATEGSSGSEFTQSPNQSVGVADQVDYLLVHDITVNDTLSLVDGAVGHAEVPASNTLALMDGVASYRDIPVTVPQTLDLLQTLDKRGPIYQPVGQNLNLHEFDEGHKGTNNQFVSSSLELVDGAGRVIAETVTDTLSLTDEGLRITRIGQVLSFIQTATGYKGKTVVQLLELTDTTSYLGEFTRDGANTISLTQSVAYRFNEDGCTKKNYVPYVGNSDGEYTPPTTTAPTLSTGTLTLTYPFVSPSLTLVLRNPAFSDRDVLNFNRVNRETRGGTLVVFADPNWPKTQTLSLQVDNLSQAKAQSLITFLETSLGQKIGLLDWEGRQWSGLIVTPDATITHVKRGDRSVEFDFQGNLV